MSLGWSYGPVLQLPIGAFFVNLLSHETQTSLSPLCRVYIIGLSCGIIFWRPALRCSTIDTRTTRILRIIRVQEVAVTIVMLDKLVALRRIFHVKVGWFVRKASHENKQIWRNVLQHQPKNLEIAKIMLAYAILDLRLVRTLHQLHHRRYTTRRTPQPPPPPPPTPTPVPVPPLRYCAVHAKQAYNTNIVILRFV